MRRWPILVGVVAGCLSLPRTAAAQPVAPASAPEADYKYRITPQAGAWFICVKSYKGPQAQQLAEELADDIRERYRIPAYLFDWGRKQRSEEQERVEKLRKQQEQFLASMSAKPIGRLRVKRYLHLEDEFAVLVGGYKDMDTARKALDDVRKLRPPEDGRLLDKIVVTGPAGEGQRPKTEAAYLNPFLYAMVVPNPTVPQAKATDDPEKPDPLLKELNAGESYSLLKCSRPYTLAVRVYQGQTSIVSRSGGSGGGFLSKIGLGGRSGDMLSASAMQAHELAKFLRSMKPSFDAYVLHTRRYSLVCVGSYDRPDDPQLQQTARTLAGMRIGGVDQLTPEPMPMKIPRP